MLEVDPRDETLGEQEHQGSIEVNRHQLLIQLKMDLQVWLEDYPSMSAGLAALHRKTTLSRKQLQRYLEGKSVPQFFNLVSLYSAIHEEKDYPQLLAKVPAVIAKAMEQRNPNPDWRSVDYTFDFSDEMKSNPAFTFIYWRTAEGNLLSQDLVRDEYGKLGIDTLKDMERRRIIEIVQKGVYTRGSSRSKPIDMEAAQKVASHMILRHFKPARASDEGQNYLGFNVLKLSPQDKQRALKMIYELNFELIRLAQKSEGSKEILFTLLVCDQMNDTDTNKDFIEWEGILPRGKS
ncbi:MAG: hypothetical protein H6624_01440 [Bdellovibrionaceae bacterium]|nr:hypothetical protein [Bdellovibrionales bacterium]MCB9082971.1 hypothetical protein [Pseudobdellovibrionaceae bacterium]